MIKYIKVVICSRIIIYILALISMNVFYPYDISTPLYDQPKILLPFMRSDVIQYIEISRNGYTSDHLTAFFPLYPLIIRFFKIILHIFSYLTITVFLNHLMFIISIIMQYKITDLLIPSKKNPKKELLIKISVLLYILNPATIIYCTGYSETLFTLVVQIGIYQIIKKKQFQAMITFSILGLIRFNFIIFIFLLEIFYLIPTLIPFSIYQLYVLGKIFKNTCDFSIIIPYTKIQREYWNQGILKFYTYNNIINFLLGFPILLITAIVVISNYKQNHSLISIKLLLILLIQLILLIITMDVNMAARFISTNPYFYIGLSNMFILYRKTFYYILRIYLVYSFIYILLFPTCVII